VISVLLVDDEPYLLNLGKLFLESSGAMTVETAISAATALEKIAHGSYDVIVADYQMPVMDGIGLLKTLRASGNSTPFIIFTGKGREEVVIEAINGGADFYLQKGGEPRSQFAELDHKIRQAVRFRRDQQALEESEVRFRALVENGSDIIRILDREGKIAYDTPATERLLGYPPDSTLGRSPLEFIHPDDVVRVKRELSNLYQNTHTGFPTEFRIRKADGSYTWVESIGKNLIGVPAVDGIVVTTRFIDERKKAEQAIRESEDTYRTVFENTGTAMVVVEENNIISLANEEFARLSGFSKDEIEGKKSWTEFVAGEDLERMLTQYRLRRQDRKKALSHYEFSFVTKYGDIRTIFLTIDLIPGTTRGVASLIDITEHKRDRQALSESRDFLNKIINSLGDPVFVKDREHRLILVNDAGCSLFDRPREDIIGRTAYGLFPSREMADISWENDEEVFQSGGENINEETNTYAIGKTLTVLVRKTLYTDSKGDQFLVGITTDITERKQSEDILKKSRAILQGIIESPWEVVIFALDRQYRYLAFNENHRQTMKRIWGADISIGVSIFDYIGTAEDREKAKRNFDRALSGESFTVIEEYGHLSCERRWFEDNYNPIIDDQGTIMGLTLFLTDVTDRLLAEEALRESEQRYHNIIEDQTELICRFLPDGTHVFVNEAYARYFGKTRDELIGTVFRADIFPDDREKFKQFFFSLTPGHPVDYIMHRIIMPDGEVRWQRWSDRAIFDERGCLVEYQSVGRDITGQKKAEGALRASEQKYRTLFNDSILGVFRSTPEGTYLDVNPAFARIYGYDSPEKMVAEITGIGQQLYVRPEDRDAITRLLATEGELRNYQAENRHRDGHSVWISINARSVKNDAGEILYYEGTVEDITERKRVGEALRASEASYRGLFNSVQQAIFIQDAQIRIIDVNDGALAMFAYSREEFTGRTPEFLLAPGRHEYTAVREKMRLACMGRPQQMELWLQRKNGEVFSNDVRLSRGVYFGQEVLITIATDITGLKQAEDALRQANRQLNLMASVTRHDILNKVTILLGYLDLAQRRSKDPEMREYLGKLEAATKAIRSQIEFTRVYQDIGTRLPQWQELEDLMPTSQLPPRITLTTDVQDISVFADPMLEKVFFNLLDNSVRHGQHVTAITVTCRTSGEGLMITWEDDGAGILPEEKELIFDRGYGKNTGLGLFLAREILAITGMTIRETGEAGKGARFEIGVPEGAYRIGL
jgi:PAS domain S-box-containing protein